ncbi:hypothetical protein Poly41_29080 [Novipirellula artificiosorum]|uniref:Uncharacterized protein n=1 Tax=Novipirellula artificiosorum TaxID=2528016 RepID=A0A5C6DPA0_9BACT|nr:hypothetical protein Poly41_29080 [Novipirellula artificiosorum]
MVQFVLVGPLAIRRVNEKRGNHNLSSLLCRVTDSLGSDSPSARSYIPTMLSVDVHQSSQPPVGLCAHAIAGAG